MASGTGSHIAYDLVVVGGNSDGLSVAIAAQGGGLGRARILELPTREPDVPSATSGIS